MEEDSVICAIATSPGMGAIAVIRVSGEGIPVPLRERILWKSRVTVPFIFNNGFCRR